VLKANMAAQNLRNGRHRVVAGAITFGAHALLLFALLFVLGRDGAPIRPAEILPVTLSDVPPPPPPPSHWSARGPRSRVRAATIVPRPAPSAPAPPAPPEVIVPLILPAPAATGTSGTGSGGVGNGNGGGGGEGGTGAGGGSPPQRIGGRISDGDYPRDLSDAGISGTVGVRYRVGVDGRARECRITKSSGSTALDAHTCALIERRFRFRPSRDAAGRPVPSIIVENHSWIMPPLPDPDAVKDR